MAMSDPVADMLTRIRNAAKAKFNSVDISGSKLNSEFYVSTLNTVKTRATQYMSSNVSANRAGGFIQRVKI